MTNHIKRLSLEFWMKFDGSKYFNPADSRSVEVKRELIGKNGWYYDRQTKECWFEVNGIGYTNEKLGSQFLYELSIHDTNPLTSEQVKQIRVLLNTLPKKQSDAIKNLREILYKDSQVKYLRNVSRDTAKMMLRFRKRKANTLI